MIEVNTIQSILVIEVEKLMVLTRDADVLLLLEDEDWILST